MLRAVGMGCGCSAGHPSSQTTNFDPPWLIKSVEERWAQSGPHGRARVTEQGGRQIQRRVGTRLKRAVSGAKACNRGARPLNLLASPDTPGAVKYREPKSHRTAQPTPHSWTSAHSRGLQSCVLDTSHSQASKAARLVRALSCGRRSHQPCLLLRNPYPLTPTWPWPCWFRSSTGVIECLCMAFNLHPWQVAFAYDPSGQCVCQHRPFLDLTQALPAAQLSWEAAMVFWALRPMPSLAPPQTFTQGSPARSR
mmetsp:Transcript_17905/g.42107  ORF Transcript_17905/g.42107 Transcript_17905/m.42107 type:complete len:252 (+) Transcript_17905:968-1723(+)